MVALYNFFPETTVESNKKSAMGALLFVSNRPKTAQEDYFQMVSMQNIRLEAYNQCQNKGRLINRF